MQLNAETRAPVLKLLSTLHDRFALIVSLPRNELPLAQAAVEGGADALKVHLNVHHHASGTTFGSWNQERTAITDIVRNVGLPVGVVPGAQTVASDDEMAEMAAMGIDFWDTFVHHAPTRLLDRKDMGCMMAVNYQFPLERAKLVTWCGAQVIEASVVPPEEYGETLTARDLIAYRVLAQNADPTPVVIPSQRKMVAGDVAHLRRAGARGIVIGAIVTGHDANTLGEATREFRRAIDLMELHRGDLDIGMAQKSPTRKADLQDARTSGAH